MNRDRYCIELANHISEVTESNVSESDVSAQLLLIELGREGTDDLIASYIKKTSAEH